MDGAPLPGSFRDPSGFLFRREGVLYRQVNAPYAEDWRLLETSGLGAELHAAGLLIPHQVVDEALAAQPGAIAVLRPDLVPFVSYPYEWSFSQLKDAARLTLEVQHRALARGMILKDASAYNVQFVAGRPVFIDTLSFTRYREGEPWVAYRQFCQHFLAPLALMARVEVRLGQLLRLHIDGVPLDLASRLLPGRTRWTLSLGLHIHAHAKSQRRHAGDAAAPPARTGAVSRTGLLGILDSLKGGVEKLEWRPGGSEWFDYYEANNNYGEQGLAEKERAVGQLLAASGAKLVWDLGANTGRFSRIAAAHGAYAVAWDIDPGCVEANYRMVVKNRERGVLPLWQDLTNPSPGLGWHNRERPALGDRGPADLVLALGLIHHLAISNNTPLEKIAELLAAVGRQVILEVVPKDDSQVHKLLATRADIFPDYTPDGIRAAMTRRFTLAAEVPIEGTKRSLLHLVARSDR